MHPLLAWLLLSLAVGYVGRHRAIGFWGFFALSLILSPLIVAVVLLLTSDAPAADERAT